MSLHMGIKAPGIICLLLALSSCQSVTSTDGDKHAAQDSAGFKESAMMARCQREIAVLEKYDKAQFIQQQQHFSVLIDNSAKYLLLREQLGTDMRSVADSIYEAQLAKRCHAIHTLLFKAVMADAEGEQE